MGFPVEEREKQEPVEKESERDLPGKILFVPRQRAPGGTGYDSPLEMPVAVPRRTTTDTDCPGEAPGIAV